MPFDPSDAQSNEPHNLDDVNSRLYRRDLAGRKVKRIDSMHQRRFSVKDNWGGAAAATEKVASIASHPSLFRKFFYFAMGFAALAIIFAGVTFFTGSNTISSEAIEINILGNSFTAGGEELPIQVEVVNNNASQLELADLFVEYEKGGDASGGASHVRELNSLGTIQGGKTATKSLFVTLYGQEGTTQNINFKLQYRLHGSNAIFVKQTVFPVTINSSPVSLSVEAPDNLTPNQQLTFTIKTKSNAADTLSGMLLHVDYPTGFKFEKATPSADAFDNTWKLGDLPPGAERTITVTGTVYGQDGEARAFHVYTGSASAKDATKIGVTYNSLLETISLVKPFLAAHIVINGSTENTVVVQSGSTVTGQISYANNLPSQITNAEITLDLSGNAFDGASVNVPRGFYDSAKRTITWNATTNPDLAVVQPSDQGSLSFSFKVLPLISSGHTLISPSVKLAVSIKGKQSDAGGLVNEVNDFEEHTAIVSSDLGFSAAAFYTSGPFANTGPIPPKANTPTTYTITWNVTNSANALAAAAAFATLPPYVEWVGVFAPAGENLLYDETTRTVRWNIGSVAASTGLAGPSRTVSFQVRLNPSSTQVGSIPKLTLDTSVTAKDTFTGATLSTSRAAVSTALQNDPGFPAGGQTVTP